MLADQRVNMLLDKGDKFNGGRIAYAEILLQVTELLRVNDAVHIIVCLLYPHFRYDKLLYALVSIVNKLFSCHLSSLLPFPF